MSSREIVEAVREEFPKFSPAALSLARRPSETGVTFVPRAAEIIERTMGLTARHTGRSENRRKSIRFEARLAPDAAQRVKNEMTRRGVTAQELVEALLLTWVAWAEKEPVPTGKVENGSKGEAVAESGFASENTTKIEGGQTND